MLPVRFFILILTILAGAASSVADEDTTTGAGWLSSMRFMDGIKAVSCALGNECCDDSEDHREAAIGNLRQILKEKFFGQHVAVETVITALQRHINAQVPDQSLVLSFHGWAGSGKSYLAQHIIKSLYEKGLESNNVKFYHPSLHFPDITKVKDYQKLVEEDIAATLKACPNSVIVLDRVESIPPEVIRAILAFTIHSAHTKAIFVFISNVGSSDINNIALEAWGVILNS